MNQISLFDGTAPFRTNKPIRLIELFAGYGSQHLALKYLGASVESYRICEWAVKSIQAYKDLHCGNDNTDYSEAFTVDEVIDYLANKGISANYNSPMTREQVKRMGEDKCRQVYNNIKATHNLVNIMQAKASDLEIVERDKYCYVMTYSFPCQDLSKAGLGKGMAKDSGTRSGLLWEVERLLDECKGNLPQVLLMENVPDVIGTKNVSHFAKWLEKLESIGYKCYWKVLNGKDYGIPQNRERCFMVSILGDYYYEFPKTIPLKLRLKDLLETEVDEKYYLSDRTIDYFVKHTEECKEKGNGFKFEPTAGDCISKCVTTRAEGRMDDNFIKEQPKCIQVGMLSGGKWDKMHDQSRRYYSVDGTAPTIPTSCGGNHEPKIAEPKFASAMGQSGLVQPVDRNYKKNKTEREEYIEWKNDNTSHALRTSVIPITCIEISKSNNRFYQQAYETLQENECEYGDTIDAFNKRVNKDGVTPTITTRPEGLKTAILPITQNYRIRKLTPKECWRLMGVKDEDFEKVAKNQSNSSLYHLAGDSIITNVLMAIFKNILGGPIWNIIAH